MVDCQVQSIGAWAVVWVSITTGVCSRCYVGSPIPGVIIAGGCVGIVVCAVVDGEIKRYGAVATCCVASGVCWGASTRIIGVSVPNETVAGGNSLNDAVTMVDSQVQGVGTWAAVVVGVVVGMYSRRIVVNFVP